MNTAEQTSDGLSAPVEVSAPELQGERDLAGRVEAILLSIDRPVPTVRIAEALGLIARQEDESEEGQERPAKSPTKLKIEEAQRTAACQRVESAVAILNGEYERTDRSFRVELISGGYRVLTLPKYAPTIAEFHRTRTSQRLSRQAVETLAIVAYKQPITRAQLEAIRGVSCGEVLKSLIERRLVTVKGRAEELGRPLLYGTTKGFLDQFGLASVKDLPTLAELKAGA